ncbi:MAG: ParB/RepB/Spo0J family partition protein [Thaumarchaeota archaeon]|nr:ParB/RepB/Spo0J family partition protein [Nitrososphaerota archaeon]
MSQRYRQKIHYRVKVIPIKKIQVWDEAQARSLDRDGIRELAKSIKNEGLQNPPMVQKDGRGRFLLMSGQRRLAALKHLRAKKIPVLVLTKGYDLENAKAASVIENLHRKNMAPKDMASSCRFLAEKMGVTGGAHSLGISRKTFKKYVGFAALPEKIKNLVPGTISSSVAISLNQIVPNVNRAVLIAERISILDARTQKSYLRLLAKHPSTNHRKLLKKARILAVRRTVPLTLSSSYAKKLEKESQYREEDPEKLARQIVVSWLSKRSHKR